MLEIFSYKVISRYHSDLLAGYFKIKKTKELVAKKYFWPSLRKNIETYVKSCNIYLISKVVRYKLYRDLQSLPMLMYQWKDFSIDFITGLPISTD